MKRYEKYKDVSSLWAESIPTHWEFNKLRSIFWQRKEKNDPVRTKEILSLSAKSGVELYSQKQHDGENKAKDDISKYNIAHKGDLVVNCMNVISGSVGLSKYYGAINPVYYALVIRNDNFNRNYYHYLFKIESFQKSLLPLGRGILMHESSTGKLNTIRMRIAMSDLYNVYLPVPPKEEQDQIVRYLDWKVSQINRLINGYKKQIKLLEERKIAVINDAVTKGIHPDVPMQTVSANWVKKIPAHWEFNKIKQQKQILLDYAKKHSYKNTMFFEDDGISETRFDREAFQRMQRMAENGEISRIIVKDLSRFGREQIEAGRLTQIVYPSLGITFISIQENVNSTTGEGMKMLLFYNIFNEWYAAQTSKKIRAVWQSKADNGKRVSLSVPFGYVKDPEDREKWLIDKLAAEIVRKIFALALGGRGPSQIARQLEKENILISSAYYESVGRKHSQKILLNPCARDQKTIVHILENRQYTGCAVNFRSTTVSYKVHKVIYNPIEEQQVISNMQEPIIPEEDWLRVQELRKNKRRPAARGRQSLFSGLVFCPDCGAKLYFCSAKSLNANQEFYCCSNYRSGRGTCKVHYIRNVVLEKIVMEAIRDFADFVRCHESVFLYMMAMKNKAIRKAEFKKMQETVEYGNRRLEELEHLMDKLYEDDNFGRLSDDVYERRVSKNEKEQKELTITVSKAQAVLNKAEQKSLDLRLLLRTFREITDIKELTPTRVNSLIERIEVHNNDKSSGHCYVKVDIYFTAVGMFKIPTEDEIIVMMEEIRKNSQEYCFAA